MLFGIIMIEPFDDEYFMKIALREALSAYKKGEVPIGAVIVADRKVIARAHNLTETLNDVTAHAEMQAITAAANYFGGKYLDACTIYITLEPCVMCAGALSWSRIGRIVFGAYDENRGYSRYAKNIMHPKTGITGGIMEKECSELITRFFKERR